MSKTRILGVSDIRYATAVATPPPLWNLPPQRAAVSLGGGGEGRQVTVSPQGGRDCKGISN